MQRYAPYWLATLLVATTVVVAWPQGRAEASEPPRFPAEVGYRATAEFSAPMRRLPATPAIGYPVANRLVGEQEKGLAERVADLEARLAEADKKAADAKKKAAGKPSVTAGGRAYVDSAAFDQNHASLNQAGDCFNGTEFRRARIFLKGDAFDVVDYKIQMDFAGQTSFKDVYMTIHELPWLGHVRIGHFKEPWSLEEQTSSRFVTFMERGLNHLFSPERNTGAMAFDHSADENMTWAVGVFAALMDDDPPIFPYDDYDDAGGVAVTTRMTYLPWYDEATDGRGLFHLGICNTYRDIPELVPGGVDRFRLRTRPEAHLAQYVADTGWLDDASSISATNAEAALVYGPLSVQSEYTWYRLERAAHDAPSFHGGYVYVSWFLTGENRRYKRSAACFDRVRPFENFFRVRAEDGCICTGKGAWELAYRWSYVNLSDAGVRGGEVIDHTLGVNWYLNPYTRLMLNYVHSETDDTQLGDGTGVVNTLMSRAQIDF